MDPEQMGHDVMIECPECGHEGPHEENERGDLLSCTECGTCFEPVAEDDCDEYLESSGRVRGDREDFHSDG
jgi:peptide subunit release factor 1 (eRF1)